MDDISEVLDAITDDVTTTVERLIAGMAATRLHELLSELPDKVDGEWNDQAQEHADSVCDGDDEDALTDADADPAMVNGWLHAAYVAGWEACMAVLRDQVDSAQWLGYAWERLRDASVPSESVAVEPATVG